MPRVPRALRRDPEPLPARQRAVPPQRGPARGGPGLAAAARRDLRRARRGRAHGRPGRPDARPAARGQRLRPHPPHARAPARSTRSRQRPARTPATPAPRRALARASRSPTTPSAARRACASTPAGPARASPPTCSPSRLDGPLGDRLRRRPARRRRLRRRGPPPAHARAIHTLHVEDGAVATSGIDTRLWRRRPTARRATTCSTRRPATPAWTGLISVTALAPTALEAEALAKAALLSGPRDAAALAQAPRRAADHRRRRRPLRMNPQDHTWWLLSRSAGIVALVLVAASTLMGLALANGLAKPPQARKSITTFHEQTANAGLAAIGLHGVTLLGDAFLHPSVAGPPRPVRHRLPARLRRDGHPRRLRGGDPRPVVLRPQADRRQALAEVAPRHARRVCHGPHPHPRCGHRRRLVLAARVHAGNSDPRGGASREEVDANRKAGRISVTPTKI